MSDRVVKILKILIKIKNEHHIYSPNTIAAIYNTLLSCSLGDKYDNVQCLTMISNACLQPSKEESTKILVSVIDDLKKMLELKL